MSVTVCSRSFAGDVVTLQLAGASQAGRPLTYAVAGLPNGLSLNAQSGLISGTLTDAA